MREEASRDQGCSVCDYPPGHYFRINVKSTIYLFVLNIVRMFLNFVSKMVDWILNTHFAVEKVDVANGREHPHY